MGLDMYLNRKRSIQVGYWRKANAIHRWFVEHVQEGEDDCQEYYVSKEKLEELLETVNTVIESSELVEGEIQNGYAFEDGQKKPIMEKGKYIKDPTVAKKLLPTTKGFFFGGTNYDQYYFEDLEATKKILETILKEKNEDIYYQSSW